MAQPSPFVEHVIDTMRAFGAVEAKPMFGGWGLYHAGLFFALVADDTLYLKVDAENRAAFDSAGLPPFCYHTRYGEAIAMSYHQAPDDALEDAEAMAEWARLAFGAALRAAARPRSRRKPRATEA